MGKLLFSIACISIFVMAQTGCVLRAVTAGDSGPGAPPDGYHTLGKLPFKEAWYGMYFKEDKVGYSHFKIEPKGKDFTISSESLMRLTAMKKTSEITMRENVDVRPDLTMISFDSHVSMSGKDLKMKGYTQDGRFRVDITVDGETAHREFPIEGKLFHSSAISLMPALLGLKDGQTHSFTVFNAEKQNVEKVEQLIWKVKGEAGPQGAIWNVKNTFGPSIIRSWLNKNGLTVLEKAHDGSLMTMLEDKESAEQFLKKKVQGKDLVLDFSLIKVATPIPRPEKTRYLKVRMQGIDPSLIARDHRQQVTEETTAGGKKSFNVSVTVEDPSPQGKRAATTVDGSILDSLDRTRGDPVSSEYLASTVAIQSDHREIVGQARKIVSETDTPLRKVDKLVRWTAENIENKMQDSFTALAVLRSREGECQSHAGLYTALARSQNIPTRLVTGIVYTDKVGFLYHAWAESYVDGWVAVDPTLNQFPADATHIKIAASVDNGETSSLLKMIGNVKLEVLEFK